MQLRDVVGSLWKRPVDDELPSDDRRRIVAAAMEFPLDEIVERYRRDEFVSKWFAHDIERELRRYLAICAMHPNETVPMYGPVDKLWHIFITFTRDYAAFCQQVAGRFIHHTPEIEEAGLKKRRRNARRFVQLYQSSFGHVPPTHVWPGMLLLGYGHPAKFCKGDWSGYAGGCGGGCGGGCAGGCGGGCGS